MDFIQSCAQKVGRVLFEEIRVTEITETVRGTLGTATSWQFMVTMDF
ncbi:hypothetical protein N8813_03845 [bacterium]|nr:hypothetical protein [bacterium]MDB4657848.1 hypothetical protein [Verrucomicrobiales bacterium]MDC0276692.1 hypothetical protein [Verrucomicrobiales bacterium]MDC0321757.1 hypothetical protein [Verrucomicrobiales bacterium]